MTALHLKWAVFICPYRRYKSPILFFEQNTYRYELGYLNLFLSCCPFSASRATD